jgi:hypothetical protein
VSDTKLLAVFMIVLAAFGLFLHSKGKLVPTVNAVVSAPATKSKNTVTIGAFIVAFITYVFVLSFLNTRDGMLLTLVVVTGGLVYNQKAMGNDSLLSVILKKTQGG